jgi:hypothetical protein
VKYNTAIPAEKKEAMSYFMRLINKKKLVEVKAISPGRTLRQNSYLHLLLSYLAAKTGYTPEEMKTLYKRVVNPDLYIYRKMEMPFLKSSADLTKEEMMITIDRLHAYARDLGYPLPQAEDADWLRELENEVEQHAWWLNGGAIS